VSRYRSFDLAGRRTLEVQGEPIPVERGSGVSVDVGADHRFVDVIENLSVLVVLAPPDTPEG
jgi:mannose-6-phosphate isomerase-like protein (cupin superfamily)